jgi:ABC-type dipeptide/oligopeptide/nickel transport system permease subunit
LHSRRSAYRGETASAIGKIRPPNAGGELTTTDYHCLAGTEVLGRDILTRLIYGARVSLLVGVIASAAALRIGGTPGLPAGYYRGRLESAVVALMDIILAFPALVLLLVENLPWGAALNIALLFACNDFESPRQQRFELLLGLKIC